MTQFGYRTLGFGSGVIPGVPYNIDILVVGGGASGGGGDAGGGGGAGGLIYKTSHEITSRITYNVVIGAGGVGVDDTGGNQGVDTTWTGKTVEFTAKGGGSGGRNGATNNAGEGAYDGGSGGGDGYGGGYNGGNAPQGGSETQTGQSGDSGTYGFGNDGGTGRTHTPGPGWVYNPAGGGGAGGVGADCSHNSNVSGSGGTGKDYSAVFADEGDSGWFGSASAGGGTAGGNLNSSAAQANTGGGSGGGGGPGGGDSGAGGSGVICFKVLTADYSGTTTGSPTTRVVGDYTIVEFTGTGSYTA